MTLFIIAAIVIVLIIIFSIVSSFNNFKTMSVQIEQEKSGIDVALSTRYDTIKQMQNAIKTYMGHEEATLVKVNAVRSGMSIEEMNAAEAQMGKAVRQFYAVAESNPQLRASEHFSTLQSSIVECESNLQAARRTYNASVATFNKKVDTFPSNLIAGRMSLQKAAFFEVADNKRDINELMF